MDKCLLFIQPIVSHYRKSLVEEITLIEPKSIFWGTENYLGVAPLKEINNVDNGFEIKFIKILGVSFVWYKNLINRFLKDKSNYIIISGINPLLIQTFIIFIIAKLFTSKKVYWWSQGKRFKQGYCGKIFRYLFYKYSDGIFLYSNEGKNIFLAEGLPEYKLHVINNCLNYEDYGWLHYSLEDNKREDFRILYTGRLSERKKIIILLKAFKLLKKNRVDNIYLDIVGDGEQKDYLSNYSKDNGIDKYVNFHGAQYGIDAHKFFLNSDIVVCPGAIGLSIVHAFSFGLPVITGKGDPAHSSELELLSSGENGDFFLLDNIESLAESILIWKGKIGINRKRYRENCIQTIINHEYLPNLVAKKLINSL